MMTIKYNLFLTWCNRDNSCIEFGQVGHKFQTHFIAATNKSNRLGKRLDSTLTPSTSNE